MTADLIAAAQSVSMRPTAAPARALAPALAALTAPPDAILAISKAASAMAQACRDHGLSAGSDHCNPENAAEVEG